MIKITFSGKAYSYLFGVLSALLCYFAWLSVDGGWGAILGWLSTLSLVLSIRAYHSPYMALYLSGIVLNVLGFHWLHGTIHNFGGFPFSVSLLLFVFFVLISGLQYPLFVFIFKALPSSFDRIGLRPATAWLAAEFIAIRIFPWQYAHTQLGFLAFAQVADVGGTALITFIMFWLCESLALAFKGDLRLLKAAPASLALVVSVFYGIKRIEFINNLPADSQKVAMVQANLSIEEKHNVQYFTQNKQRYIEMTKAIAEEGLLVIWPETVIQDWIYTSIGLSSRDNRLPRFEQRIALLTGALTFRNREEIFNSALAIYPDGSIPEPSHKQILMPFGEYTPFSSVFPWLADLNPTAGNFTAGQDLKVFAIPTLNLQRSKPIYLSALICYEDVIPDLARQATLKGAELLVNLTNDAWFGKSIAPYHHHLIASFRAIENRRYLLRATNSGFTAIVNPLGQTIASLPTFSEGTLLASVDLIGYKSIYTRYVGELPRWIILAVCLLSVLHSMLKARGKRAS